jgi:hypothetical protein
MVADCVTVVEQMCNVHCSLSWELGHTSNCSSSCGPGHRTLSYTCTKITANVKKVCLFPICMELTCIIKQGTVSVNLILFPW